MTEITDLGRNVWRDWVTDGQPSTGAHWPPKAALRDFAAAIDLQKASAIETLAAFKALVNAPEIVLVKGKTAANDGWGGVFMRIAGSVTAGDDALVLRRTAGGDSYWRVVEGTLDARWFGFKADGVSGSGAANSAALQAAVTKAIAWACDLVLPASTAYLASTVTIPGSMKMKGRGWGTILRPTADAIGIMFNITGSTVEFSDMLINGDTVVAPTFTAVKVDTPGGFVRGDNVYIYACGVGIDMPAGNACRYSNMRIQACPVCVKSGGVAGSYPGDTTWKDVVLIPTNTGTGWIIDGNTNAQYVSEMVIIGGAINLHLRGAGSGTSTPDGILQDHCNYTAASGPIIKIEKARNFQLNDSVVGGSTAEDGILISPAATADVDGIMIDGSQIRGNYKRGINWEAGANLQITGGQVYGNSNGGGSGVYSNVYVGAAAKGQFTMVGVMAGLSKSGEVFANIAGPAKYGVELAAGALTDATNFPGRCFILNNFLDGNTVGRILDGSAPVGSRKAIDNPGGRRGDPIVVTAEYTARPGDLIWADTTAGAFTIHLPAVCDAPITIVDIAWSWATNNLTLDPGAVPIAVPGDVDATSVVCSTAGVIVTAGLYANKYRML